MAKLSPTMLVASVVTVSPGTRKNPPWVQARMPFWPKPGQNTVPGGANVSVGVTVADSPGSTGALAENASPVSVTDGPVISVANQPGWLTRMIEPFGGSTANAPLTPSASPTRGSTLVWSSRVVPSAAYRLTTAGALTVLAPVTVNARGSSPGAMRKRKRRGLMVAS